MFDRFTPKFVRQYAAVSNVISSALLSFSEDVTGRSFPAEEHTYQIKESELNDFHRLLEEL